MARKRGSSLPRRRIVTADCYGAHGLRPLPASRYEGMDRMEKGVEACRPGILLKITYGTGAS